MTISVSLPKELVDRIKKAADKDHRDVSKQIAYFCDKGLSSLYDSDSNDKKKD